MERGVMKVAWDGGGLAGVRPLSLAGSLALVWFGGFKRGGAKSMTGSCGGRLINSSSVLLLRFVFFPSQMCSGHFKEN